MFPSTVVQVDTEHDKVVTLEKRIQTLQQQLAHGVNIGHFISKLHGFMVLCSFSQMYLQFKHKSLEKMKQLTISHDSNLGFGEEIQCDTGVSHIPPMDATCN